MKKNYIYILIGVLCFLSFSTNVRADYKEICKYTYSGQNTDGNRVVYNVVLSRDTSEENLFQMEATKLSGESNLTNEVSQTFTFKSIDAKGYVYGKTSALMERKPQIYSYSNLTAKSSCPSNIRISSDALSLLEKGEYCFSNNSQGYKWCAEKYINNTNLQGKYDTEEAQNYINKTSAVLSLITTSNKTSSSKYSNIKDGSSCKTPIATDGNSGEKMVYVIFSYEDNDLVVRYSNSEDGKYTVVEDNVIKFETNWTIGDGNPDKQVYRNLYLTNANADLHSESVILYTRNDFNKAYLEEWNKNGKCPEISVDSKGDGNNFYLLLPNAKKDAEEYGSSKIDVDNLVSLPSWDHDWSKWGTNETEYENCEGLLGEKIINMINDVLTYVKVLVPIALIAFGIIDFTKAVFSTKEDSMKKAQMNFIKRLIMAVVIFIVPSIINLLLNTVDGIWAHINNSACNIWK